MKKLFFFLALFIIGSINAQSLFNVSEQNQPDVKLFVVDDPNQADLNVHEVRSADKAKSNDGIWFFTKNIDQAEKKVCFVKKENQADLKIYFVSNQNEAGWRNESKKSLLN